jgi:RNA polymerase sigma factor (sigma-70 family)
MEDAQGSSTSSTLLGRLRQDPKDQAAWEEFTRRYQPKVYEWGRCLGLQDADALDVAQDVLVKLIRTIDSFRYDHAQSFRGWLRTLTRHAWSDHLGKRNRAGPGSARDEVHERLQTIEAREELVKRIEQEFDLELKEQAEQDVKKCVEPDTWAAYELTEKKGFSNKDAAVILGIPKKQARVAVYRNRVRKKEAQAIREREDARSTEFGEDKS